MESQDQLGDGAAAASSEGAIGRYRGDAAGHDRWVIDARGRSPALETALAQVGQASRSLHRWKDQCPDGECSPPRRPIRAMTPSFSAPAS